MSLATCREINLDITEWGKRFLKPFGEDVDCDICGDFHDADNVPLSCASGDGN